MNRTSQLHDCQWPVPHPKRPRLNPDFGVNDGGASADDNQRPVAYHCHIHSWTKKYRMEIKQPCVCALLRGGKITVQDQRSVAQAHVNASCIFNGQRRNVTRCVEGD